MKIMEHLLKEIKFVINEADKANSEGEFSLVSLKQVD